MKRKAMKNNVIERKGFNVYGEPCVERIVTLEKGTAIQQYMEIVNTLKNAKKVIEYTLYFKDFSKEEIEQFNLMAGFINRKYGI